MKPLVAVDIDDVLSASAEGFVEFSNQTFGTALTIKNYTEHWAELWQVDQDELSKRAVQFYNSGTLAAYTYKEGAKDTLTKLKAKYDFIAITSRQSKSQDITNAWIDKHYPGIFTEIKYAGIFDDHNDVLHEAMLSRTKGEMFASSNVQFVIDDQLKHCLAAAELGIEAILFGDYTWNQADPLPELVTRAHDWQVVLEFFNGKA